MSTSLADHLTVDLNPVDERLNLPLAQPLHLLEGEIASDVFEPCSFSARGSLGWW